MPHVTHVEWPAGDADRLQGFLEGLFGWSFNSPMEGVDYRMAQASENQGAAVYPSEDSSRGLMVYYDVDDIDGCIAKVSELGGKSDEKMPVPGMGWFSRSQDTEGNTFGLWQTDPSAPTPEG
jgi:predicted enzyme related to lactoylglutathione lyase